VSKVVVVGDMKGRCRDFEMFLADLLPPIGGRILRRYRTNVHTSQNCKIRLHNSTFLKTKKNCTDGHKWPGIHIHGRNQEFLPVPLFTKE
jgi:hypothetical protein